MMLGPVKSIGWLIMINIRLRVSVDMRIICHAKNAVLVIDLSFIVEFSLAEQF